jgi:hypothetical protein
VAAALALLPVTAWLLLLLLLLEVRIYTTVLW